MDCLFPNCTPDTCTCVPSPEEIAAAMDEERRKKAARTLAMLRSELDRVKREYEQHGQPFGPDGFDTWLEFGGESGVN